MEKLHFFIQQLVTPKPEEMEAFFAQIEIEKFKKGSRIFKEGTDRKSVV